MNKDAIKSDNKHAIVKNRLVFLSKRGSFLERNIIYILKELQKEEYANLKLNLVCLEENKEKVEKKLSRYNIRKVRLVILDSKLYFEVLNSAEFVITNSPLDTDFIKKEGQKLIYIWHKTMMKKVEKPKTENSDSFYFSMQRSLNISDYFVVRNAYTIPRMLELYGVDSNVSGKYVTSGFPRNSLFLENREEKQIKIRTDLGLLEKKIYLYVPCSDEPIRTKDPEQFADQLLFYMQQLNEQLTEDEVCLIKYPLTEGWNERWNSLQHIVLCPSKYELYSYLDVADVLITDYSDCYFDYLISRKKIVLFAYDYPLLRQKVDFDIPLDKQGIPLVYSILQLVKELRSPVNYDSEAIVLKFGTYDCVNAAEKLCHRIFFNQDTEESK